MYNAAAQLVTRARAGSGASAAWTSPLLLIGCLSAEARLHRLIQPVLTLDDGETNLCD